MPAGRMCPPTPVARARRRGKYAPPLDSGPAPPRGAPHRTALGRSRTRSQAGPAPCAWHMHMHMHGTCMGVACTRYHGTCTACILTTTLTRTMACTSTTTLTPTTACMYLDHHTLPRRPERRAVCLADGCAADRRPGEGAEHLARVRVRVRIRARVRVKARVRDKDGARVRVS